MKYFNIKMGFSSVKEKGHIFLSLVAIVLLFLAQMMTKKL